MSYTKIPATNIGSALGSAIGSAAGSVATMANKALDLVEARIKVLQQKADELQTEIRVVQDSAEEQILIESAKTTTPSNGGGAYVNFLQATGISEGIPTLVQNLDAYKKKLLQETELIVRQKVTSFNLSAQTEVAIINATMEAATVVLTAILKVLVTLENIVKLLQVPIPILKAVIPVIKLLPLPLRYLISSFIILESDLLEMTEQLIAQTLDEISAIGNIITSIRNILQPILDRVEKIRASVALLNMERLLMSVSETDKEVLDQAGLFDRKTNESLLGKIQDGLLTGNLTSCYGISNVPDLSQSEIGNKLQLSNPGDVISLDIHPQGSYIEPWFCMSEKEPEIPIGFPRNSGSWSKEPPVEALEKATIYDDKNFNGEEGIQGKGIEESSLNSGSWSKESSSVKALEKATIYDDGENFSEEGIQGKGIEESSLNTGKENESRCWKVELEVTGMVSRFDREKTKPQLAVREDLLKTIPNLGTEEYLVLGYSNFDKKPGILKIDDWMKLLEVVLDKLRNLPLSQELKDDLSKFWNIQVASTKSEGIENQTSLVDKFHWMSPSGELFTLTVVEDSHSPKVAVRRFVRVANSQGIVVLEGLKTFSTSIDTLLEEVKLQLAQLMQ